jgi:CPA1 family monovalent cation:H+ antiporter
MQLALPPVGLGYRDYATPADWAKTLATFPVFAGIPRRRLRELAQDATFAEYAPGDTVVQRGGRGDSLFVILSGSASVLGKPAARPLGTGDYFGELGALEGAPRSATIIAKGELHVMRLPRESFLRLVERDPTVSLQMLGNLGSQIRRLETLPARS